MKKNIKGKLAAVVISIVVLASIIVGAAVINNRVDTSELERYEVYRSYDKEYKEVCSKYYKDSLESGMNTEDACKEAIEKTQEYVLEDMKAFTLKYCVDEDHNGVYDGIDRKEVTEEEIAAKFGTN